MARSVIFVDHALALGGAEHSLLLVLKHLDRARWRAHLATSGGPLADRARGLGVRVHVMPLARLRRSPRALPHWLAGARALADLAKEADAALLAANTVRAALYVALAARLAGVPFVWHMRDYWLTEAYPRRPWADRLGKRLLCGAAAAVIANSHAVARALPCPAKVTVVHNGIEVERFDPSLDGRSFRRQHGIPLDAPLVGVVGRLRPWKGQDRFLRAMAMVAREVPEARFAVVGGAIFDEGDEYPDHLRSLAAHLGLSERVVFTGHLEDVRPALAAMDLFVHPGDPEPFGLAIVEAMAMRKPVLAFAHGALPEIVLDGETGALIAPGDEEALALAAIALLGDRPRLHAFGRAARRRMEERFTADRMAAQVTAVLEGLVSRG